jgi:hypothetical protein
MLAPRARSRLDLARQLLELHEPLLALIHVGSSLTILLARDLGIVKYIKDEDDADLHADLSVYDALG